MGRIHATARVHHTYRRCSPGTTASRQRHRPCENSAELFASGTICHRQQPNRGVPGGTCGTSGPGRRPRAGGAYRERSAGSAARDGGGPCRPERSGDLRGRPSGCPARHGTRRLPFRSSRWTWSPDPVGNGWAASLAHPGVQYPAGIFLDLPDFSAKTLQLFCARQSPTPSRLRPSGIPASGSPQLKSVQNAAATLGVELEVCSRSNSSQTSKLRLKR